MKESKLPLDPDGVLLYGRLIELYSKSHKRPTLDEAKIVAEMNDLHPLDYQPVLDRFDPAYLDACMLEYREKLKLEEEERRRSAKFIVRFIIISVVSFFVLIFALSAYVKFTARP